MKSSAANESIVAQIEPAPALSMSLRTALPWRAATLLLPYEGAEAPAAELSFDGRHATVSAAELGEVEVKCSLP